MLPPPPPVNIFYPTVESDFPSTDQCWGQGLTASFIITIPIYWATSNRAPGISGSRIHVWKRPKWSDSDQVLVEGHRGRNRPPPQNCLRNNFQGSYMQTGNMLSPKSKFFLSYFDCPREGGGGGYLPMILKRGLREGDNPSPLESCCI